MLKLVGAFKNSYKVEDTETGEFMFLTAAHLLTSLTKDVYIDGCRFGPRGLSLTIDGTIMDVDIEVFKPVFVCADSTNYRFEVSNLGRVKKVCCIDIHGNGSYEHFLKSSMSKTAVSKSVRILVNGEARIISLAKLVAKEFIPNPNGLKSAVRKDSSLDDYGAWNIKWTASNSWLNGHNCGRKRTPVRQYTLDGEFVKEWPAAMDASRNFGGSSNSLISGVCLRKPGFYTAYGFIWRYPWDDEYFGAEVKPKLVKYLTSFNKAKSKPVRQYTKAGVFVAEFASSAEAFEKTGIRDTTIGQVCRRVKGYYTAGGHIWRYPWDDEFASKG